MVAAAFLDGHAAFAVVEEAGVTLAALSTGLWALRGGAERRAAQGTGICAELVVAVGVARHRCKEGIWVRAPGIEGLQTPGLPLQHLHAPTLCPSLTAEGFGPPGFNLASSRLASTHIGMNVAAKNALVPATQAEIKDTILQGALGIQQFVAGGQRPRGAGEEPAELLLLVLLLQLRLTLRLWLTVPAGRAGGRRQAGRVRHSLLPGVAELIGAACLRAVRLLEVVFGVVVVVPTQAAQLLVVVAWDGDPHIVLEVVGHAQAKVGLDHNVRAMLEGVDLAVGQHHWQPHVHTVHLGGGRCRPSEGALREVRPRVSPCLTLESRVTSALWVLVSTFVKWA